MIPAEAPSVIPSAQGGDSAGDSQERKFLLWLPPAVQEVSDPSVRVIECGLLILSETVELEGCDGWGCGDPFGFVCI